MKKIMASSLEAHTLQRIEKTLKIFGGPVLAKMLGVHLFGGISEQGKLFHLVPPGTKKDAQHLVGLLLF